MTVTCEACGDSFEAERSTARFCRPACRAQAWRDRSHNPVIEPGDNAAALEELLVSVDGVDAATMQAARSLAALVDSEPGNAALWSRYLQVLDRLRDQLESHNDRVVQDLLAELQMPPS